MKQSNNNEAFYCRPLSHHHHCWYCRHIGSRFDASYEYEFATMFDDGVKTEASNKSTTFIMYTICWYQKNEKFNFRNIKSTKIAKRMVAITAVVALSIIIPSACLLLLLPCRYLRQQHPPSVSPHSPTSFFLTGITVPCDEHEMYFILWLKSSSTTTMSW